MTPPEPPHEGAGLPAWLYPAGFWVAVAGLAFSAALPRYAYLGVWWVMLVPVLAALYVALTGWTRDRRVSLAAWVALAGLAVVFAVKQVLT